MFEAFSLFDHVKIGAKEKNGRSQKGKNASKVWENLHKCI